MTVRRGRLWAVGSVLTLVAGAVIVAGNSPPGSAAVGTDLPVAFSPGVSRKPVVGVGHLSTISRDGNANTRLSDGRGFWAFADTGYRDALGRIGFVSSSATFSRAGEPNIVRDRLGPDGSLAQLIPASTNSCGASKPFYWPRSAARVGSGATEDVYVYYEHVCNGIGVSSGVARYRVSATGTVKATVLNRALFGPGTQPGSASAARDGDPYLYVFWTDGSIRVGRVTPANAGTTSAYRYWNGSTWVPDRNAAAGLGFSCCFKISVQWVPAVNRWVMADYAGGYASANDPNRGRAVLRFAPNPQGPWSSAQYADLPGCNRSGSGTPTSKDCRAVEVVPSGSTADGVALAYHNPMVRSGLKWTGFDDGQTQVTRARISPFGVLDKLFVDANGRIRAEGWALDPESTGPVTMAVSIDGATSTPIGPANVSRSNVASSYPAYGAAHGFALDAGALPAGSHLVCINATNIGQGMNTRIGCRQLWTASRFMSLTPKRLLDTRPAQGGRGSIPANGGITLAVRGHAGIPSTATSVVLNLTASGASKPGSIRVWPGGRSQPANPVLFFEPPRDVAQLTTVGLDSTGQLKFSSSGAATHLIADVVGYYESAGTTTIGRTVNVLPARFLDTRPGAKVPGGSVVQVQITGRGGVPTTGVSAVIANLTLTGVAATNTSATAWPGGAALPSPLTPNVVSSDTRSNQVVVPLGSTGKVSLRPTTSSDLILDVVGYVTSGSAPSSTTGRYVAFEPQRFLDTVGGARKPSGSVTKVTVAGRGSVPSTARGVVGTLSAVSSNGAGYQILYPYGAGRPTVTSLNIAGAGQSRSNQVVGALGGGAVNIYASGIATHEALDVGGWFTP